MSDLVKRLRDHIAVSFDDRGHVFEDDALCDDAADRIEELEAKNNLLKTSCIIEVAKLEKALESLKRISTYRSDRMPSPQDIASKTIRELTGGKDE